MLTFKCHLVHRLYKEAKVFMYIYIYSYNIAIKIKKLQCAYAINKGKKGLPVGLYNEKVFNSIQM